eukprot:749108-Hanusia_phi.AAC.2
MVISSSSSGHSINDSLPFPLLSALPPSSPHTHLTVYVRVAQMTKSARSREKMNWERVTYEDQESQGRPGAKGRGRERRRREKRGGEGRGRATGKGEGGERGGRRKASGEEGRNGRGVGVSRGCGDLVGEDAGRCHANASLDAAFVGALEDLQQPVTRPRGDLPQRERIRSG